MLQSIVSTTEFGPIRNPQYGFEFISGGKDGVPQMWVAKVPMIFNQMVRMK